MKKLCYIILTLTMILALNACKKNDYQHPMYRSLQNK